MQLPVVRLLREMGVGPLVVWGPRPAVDLVTDHPLADAVLPDAGRLSPWAMAAILRRHRAARAIHFPKSLRPALGAFLARVPERIGVDESLQGPFNTHSGPFWKAEGPFMLRYHKILQRRWPDLPAMPFADYDPGVEVASPAGPYLCLMPGSTWPSKAWPASHFRSLAARARSEGFEVAVLGVPAEAGICGEVSEGLATDLCGRTGLREAAAWLRGARGALGNDSGLSHLAAATGTAVVALYGATDPGGSAPWGPRTRSLRLEDIPCAPCFQPACTVDGHPCLDRISPDEAWEALRALLN